MPVAYYSKAFDGAQGSRHPGWREAYGLVAAVNHFYPYLDGCANLIIETDATTALGLFTHKTKNCRDDLSRFRAELSSLGLQQHMVVHRSGETQLTADWLSRVLDRLRTPKKGRKEVVGVPEDPVCVGAFLLDAHHLPVDESEVFELLGRQ